VDNLKKYIKVGLYMSSIIWTAWLIFKSTEMLDSYITVIIMMSSMIINDLMR